jgi:hypothetical protein
MAKKASKIKNKSSKAAPVIAKGKSMVKTLAKGLAKAMGGKAAKKPQTKAAPKAVSASKVAKFAKPAKPVKAEKEVKFGKSVKAVTAEKTEKPEKIDKNLKKDLKNEKVDPKQKAKEQALVAAVLAAEKAHGKGKPKAGSKAAAAAAHLERMCRETGCENQATTKGYCRLDYIKNWKKIKRKEMILKEGKLNQYIEELVSKYPDKYIEVIRQDLSTEVNFNKVIHDLELDESIDDLDYDGDSIDSLIGSIRKEDDDFGDTEF